MKKEFDIHDLKLSLIKHYLEIEVEQQNIGIFIS